jgi:hypothetical protein
MPQMPAVRWCHPQVDERRPVITRYSGCAQFSILFSFWRLQSFVDNSIFDFSTEVL